MNNIPISEKQMDAFYQSLIDMRLDFKARENANKPAHHSDYYLYTTDFTFNEFNPDNREGDSGRLLLAKSIEDPLSQYVVKHEFTDSAANEFMYSLISNELGIPTPVVKLFIPTDDEKPDYFKTEYIMGAEYIPNANTDPSREEVLNANNWPDYFRNHALELMLCECDGLEFILSSDNTLMRVDTTSTFALSDMFISSIGADVPLQGVNIHESAVRHISNRGFEHLWSNTELDIKLEYLQGVSKDGVAYFWETIGQFCDFPIQKIEQLSIWYPHRPDNFPAPSTSFTSFVPHHGHFNIWNLLCLDFCSRKLYPLALLSSFK